METLRASLLEHLPVTAAAVAAGVMLTGVVHLVTTRSRARSFRPSLQPVGVLVDVVALVQSQCPERAAGFRTKWPTRPEGNNRVQRLQTFARHRPAVSDRKSQFERRRADLVENSTGGSVGRRGWRSAVDGRSLWTSGSASRGDATQHRRIAARVVPARWVFLKSSRLVSCSLAVTPTRAQQGVRSDSPVTD